MAKTDLSAARLRELLSYNPDNGVFTWIAPLSNVVRPGSIAGTHHLQGYISIGVDGVRYLAHRLAWLHHYGEWPLAWPAGQVDHINRIKTDNRISNLRIVSSSENKQNRDLPHTNNRLGFLGVSRNGRRFMASIMLNGKVKHLGTHDTPELASAAYMAAKRIIHPGALVT